MVRGRVAGDSVADVGPASVMVGNIVQGNRLASAQGRDMGVLDEDSDNAKKVRDSRTSCDDSSLSFYEKQNRKSFISPLVETLIISCPRNMCARTRALVSFSNLFFQSLA